MRTALLLYMLAGCTSEEAITVELPVTTSADAIPAAVTDLGYSIELAQIRIAVSTVQFTIEGEMHAADGRTFRQRISWQKQGEAVREWALLSKDGGATWSPAFDVVFRKRSAPRER